MSGTTDQNKPGSAGTDQNPAGTGETPPKTDDKGTVSYDTHQRLLSEKKAEAEKRRKAEEELETLRKEKADRETKRLEEEGKWKELAEAKDKALKEAEEKNSRIMTDLNQARKKQAILKAISGTVPANAHALLPLDMVKIGDDGKVDEATAKLAAQSFEKDYSFAVQRDKPNGGLPNDAPGGGTKKLTVAEWNALPAAQMKERAGEVDWSTAK